MSEAGISRGVADRLEILVPGLTVTRHVGDDWLEFALHESAGAALAERLEQAEKLLDSLATDITAAINEWRDGNRDDRRRRQGLRQALEIVNARRGAL